MKNLTPDQVAAKWSSRASAASTDWVDGINATTVSPGQAAAAQADVWLANTQAAATKWKTSVANVSLADWKAQTVAKGQARYSGGVQAGQSKYANKISKILQAEKSIVSSLPPRGNVSQNIQRSAAFQQAMHQAASNGQFS